MNLFGTRLRFNPFGQKNRKIPDGVFTKCEKCGATLTQKEVEEQSKTCPKCNFHFTLGARERIETLCDPDSFKEYDGALESCDPLDFKGPKTYAEKIKQDQEKTGMTDAVLTGIAKICDIKISLGVTDSRFIMGSMGSVVGEKLTRAMERAIEEKIPMVTVSGSGGGARMYEGCFSLMQMAKTSAAVSKMNEAGIPYISILTHPTMGGVLASFASLGHINIAEPGALIGFAGPRVIADTIKQELPEGFQRSEYLLEHGMVDRVVDRKELRSELQNILTILGKHLQ